MDPAEQRVPEEAYRLTESIATIEEGALAPDGTVNLHVMRPCVGRGKGNHLYEADMLRANAHKFSGWRMHVDHLSEAAQRQLGGLPRPIRDYGGRVLESWWDPSVPSDESSGFGQGAVVARVRPSFQVRPFIEDDPQSVEASINARATAVKPTTRGGERVWMVEGIEDKGTIDWVSEAGAGGRVVSLLESAYHESEMAGNELLESMTDDEFADYLRERRPELVEALGQPDPGKEKHVSDTPQAPETPESPAPDAVGILREALSSYEGREMVRGLMEADFREEADIIRAGAEATARREVEVERMKAEAHRLIREAELPTPIADELYERYATDEAGAPTPALDQVDLVEDGEVSTRAIARLREAVNTDIKRKRDLLEALDPTRVKGQGDTEGGDASEGGGEPAPSSKRSGKSLWRRQLQEAGFEDPDKVYEAV